MLAANGVETIIQRDDGVTPTPVISRAILAYNRGRTNGLADGIVITPSHNPPEDGGFKYNPPNGGPADTDVTAWVQDRANDLLRAGLAGVRRLPYAAALGAPTTHQEDFILPYVHDLQSVVDMDAIRSAGLTLGVDPLGGAAAPYWEPINARYGTQITVVNPVIDPTFSFMTVDHDGRIRMDPSSPYAMAGLVGLKDRFRVAFANDPDADRHGIVTRSVGPDEPEPLPGGRDPIPAHPSAGVAARRRDRQDAGQQRPDRPGRGAARPAPVRSAGRVQVVRRRDCSTGRCCFGGEESAGASFLRHDGTVWSTDKDGPIMDLLAAEITARTGKDPGEHYQELEAEFGRRGTRASTRRPRRIRRHGC